ncbi:uncharacterized protein [Nicotiana sylvestris]|uniref:uncharacterized protein n=1 Tax=Nicotiana sylvestris TaxID=4096 RepID=UPI00388CCD25
MTSENNFVQAAIPRFDVHYDHWSMLMENLLRSKELWAVVNGGIQEPGADVVLTNAQKTQLEAQNLRELKAKNYLFQAIDRSILEIILLCKDTSKKIWDSMTNTKGMQGQSEPLQESKDLDTLSFDELQNSLMVHEQKIVKQDTEEQALQAITTFKDSVCRRNKWKGRNSNKAKEGTHKKNGQHGRDQQHSSNGKPRSADKSHIECYRCHRYGHYRSECRTNLKNVRGENSNFTEVTETEEEVSLLMVSQSTEERHTDLCYLDTGCSNYMCGEKSTFSELDETFRTTVKLGDNSRLATKGKGRILDSNLGLIAEAKMTANKLFPLHVQDIGSTNFYFSAKLDSQAWLWHYIYGHLNFGGLKLLLQKNMVSGLPNCHTSFFQPEGI